MSDEYTPTPEEPAIDPDAVDDTTAEAAAGDAEKAGALWRDVLTQIEALGDAVGRWASASMNDPDNRRRAEELKDTLEGMGRTVGDTVDKATKTEVGQTAANAAKQAGETIRDMGEKFGQEVGPHIIGAFKAAADGLKNAAERMEAKAATAASAEKERAEAQASAASQDEPQRPGPHA